MRRALVVVWWVTIGCAGLVAQREAAVPPADVLDANGFVGREAPFLRSAMTFDDDGRLDRTRRGVLLRLEHDLWACFDPDLLRWSALWRTRGPDRSPVTLDSMAAISYPAEKAKSDHAPQLAGSRLWSSRELPGAGVEVLAAEDPRPGRLADGRRAVGPLPTGFGRYDGLELCGAVPVVEYTVGGVALREAWFAVSAECVLRAVELAANERTIVLRIDDGSATLHDDGSGTIAGAALLELALRGDGAALRGDRHGTWLELGPGASRTVVVQRATRRGPVAARVVPKPAPAEFPPPDSARVDSDVQGARTGGLKVRELELPPTDGRRTVRPTDIGFLADGDALVVTLDGDLWRVADLETRTASWRRVAGGMFETTNVEVGPGDEVFVLGRDQVTRLVDRDGDGRYDRYENAADGFWQTLHTRDYAMSMVREPDGSFLVAKGGIDVGKRGDDENDPHRGAILRVTRAGAEVLADGLRLPYVGRRDDGAVFASDQQGNWIPTTPVLRIGGDAPSFGFAPTRHRGGDAIAEPFTWFPYRSNRSGAGFVTLGARAFPALADRFVHVSWDGRLFVLGDPADGRAFGWRLPMQFSFPSLNAAVHPLTDTLYAVGIGISGYLPTTARTAGLAAVRQQGTLLAPRRFDVDNREGGGGGTVAVEFVRPVPASCRVRVAALRFWSVRRSAQYGSGHYRWDGSPGEHHLTPSAVTWSRDRRRVELALPSLYRCSLAALLLDVSPGGRETDYTLELFTTPTHLREPDAAELQALREAPPGELRPGDATSGREVFARQGCVGCHSLQGQALVGPPLDGVATRHARGLEAFLRESILEPHRQIAAGYSPSMPSFEGVVGPQDLEHLIAFLKELK